MWYYATILYFGNYYRRDPRERGGLAASAIAVSTPSVLSNPLFLPLKPACAGIFSIFPYSKNHAPKLLLDLVVLLWFPFFRFCIVKGLFYVLKQNNCSHCRHWLVQQCCWLQQLFVYFSSCLPDPRMLLNNRMSLRRSKYNCKYIHLCEHQKNEVDCEDMQITRRDREGGKHKVPGLSP